MPVSPTEYQHPQENAVPQDGQPGEAPLVGPDQSARKKGAEAPC
jgi:hypothetical protein